MAPPNSSSFSVRVVFPASGVAYNSKRSPAVYLFLKCHSFPVVFAGAKLAKKLGVERLAVKVLILNYSWKKIVQTGTL
jgi:hypothetical protein